MIERTLRPILNDFCRKETGNQLSDVINLFLVYMFENIIRQNTNFKNSTLKDLVRGLLLNILDSRVVK